MDIQGWILCLRNEFIDCKVTFMAHSGVVLKIYDFRILTDNCHNDRVWQLLVYCGAGSCFILVLSLADGE